MKIHLNRKTLLAALMSAAVFSTALPVQAQTKREIKVSHSAQGVMSSELHMAAWVFSNYVKENSDTLTVRIYPNNALGEERAVYE
ncbi:MAG: hypothetical protein ACTS5Y_06625, partial [Pollutimonas bauzanensis]